MYNIFFLEENDNIRIVFDKLDLINDLVDLYKQIGVTMLIVDANTKISQVEKDMIVNTLGKISFKKREDVNIRNLLLNIVKNVQEIEINKSKIEFTLPISYLKEINIENEKGGLTQEAFDNKFKNALLPHSSLEKSPLERLYNDIEFPVPIGTELTFPIPISHPNMYSINPSNEANNVNPIISGTSEYTYLMDSWWQENKTESIKNSFCVLYNQDNECSLVCHYTLKIKGIADEFGDFIILREYNNIPDKSIVILKELIHNNMYCEKIAIQKKLDAFESLYDVTKINQQEDEKSLIIFYIKQNYIISDDVSKRIKVSVLLEEVESELKIYNTNLKYNFANYLYDIGLQKKRYADGMYLYGIESKANAKINDLKKVKLNNNDYEKFLDSRTSEIKEIYNARTKGELKS